MPKVLDGRTQAKRDRLLFATACTAAVFPGIRDDLQTKAANFEKAAALGAKHKECPLRYRDKSKLHTYIKNHWPVIRLMLPEHHDILPVYVNGAEFGGGGGYRKGDRKHAQKQLERDAKIADGVVSAANDYAEVAVGIFPQVTAERRNLVARQIAR